MYLIPGWLGMKFLAHQVCVIWFIVRRWISDADTPGALVAVKMHLGKTCTSMAAAMIQTLLTDNVEKGSLLSILWENTIAECVDIVQNDSSGTIGEGREWYPFQ
jgi:hypothetical protein